MTDQTDGRRQQVANAGLYMLPLLIGNLLPIITLPVFTRLLSAEDFGAWALASAYSVVVGGIAAVGLPIAYDRNFFAHRDSPQGAELLYSVIAFSAASFALCGIVTWFLRAPITRWLIGDGVYRNVLVASFGTTAIVGIKAYYFTYLRNSEQAGLFSAYTIAERLLAAALTLGLVAWARMGVMGLVVGQLLAALIVLTVIAARFLQTLPLAFNRRLLTDAVGLGVPMMPRILFGVLGNNFDKYLIGQISSLGGVGIYSIAQRVANIAFTYMTALQNVFGPQVYKRMFSGDPGAGASIGRYLTPFAYVSTVLVFLIAVFSEEILKLLAAPAFQAAVPIVTILALYNGIQFFGKLPQVVYARKTYLISILAAVTTGLTIGFGATGVWLLGTIGAAWGALAAGLVSIGLTLWVGQRCYRIDWQTGRMAAIFGLLFACAFLTVGLRALGFPYALRLAAKLVSLVAFTVLGAKLEIITFDNIALVRDIVLRRRTAL